MAQLILDLNGDGCWPDLKGKDFIHLGNGAPPIGVAVLSGGTDSGKPSVSFRFDLPDGRTVLAETTARLFVTAAKAIEAKFPDLFQD